MSELPSLVIAIMSCKKNLALREAIRQTWSVNVTHSINNAYPGDAKKSCNNYQDQANNTLPGGTTCHL